MRLGAARVSLAGERVARSAQLAASFVAAEVDRVSLRGPSEALILLGGAKRRAAEMAMNLDRLLLQLDDVGRQNLRFVFARWPSAVRAGERAVGARAALTPSRRPRLSVIRPRSATAGSRLRRRRLCLARNAGTRVNKSVRICFHLLSYRRNDRAVGRARAAPVKKP